MLEAENVERVGFGVVDRSAWRVAWRRFPYKRGALGTVLRKRESFNDGGISRGSLHFHRERDSGY